MRIWRAGCATRGLYDALRRGLPRWGRLRGQEPHANRSATRPLPPQAFCLLWAARAADSRRRVTPGRAVHAGVRFEEPSLPGVGRRPAGAEKMTDRGTLPPQLWLSGVIFLDLKLAELCTELGKLRTQLGELCTQLGKLRTDLGEVCAALGDPPGWGTPESWTPTTDAAWETSTTSAGWRQRFLPAGTTMVLDRGDLAAEQSSSSCPRVAQPARSERLELPEFPG